MRSIHRDIDLIDPALRSKIREVCLGRSGWPITIIGPAGTGKTCAALCMLDRIARVMNGGPEGGRRYITTADLILAINVHRRSDTPAKERTFWKEWKRCKLVVLDEIGAREKVTDAHYEILKMAIDYRQDQPAVYLSNLPISTLAEIYDDRIASRLQSGTVIDLTNWRDRRVVTGSLPASS